MTDTSFVFTPPKDLLSEHHLTVLSRPAVRVFTTVWNRMSRLQTTTLATINQSICDHARLDIEDLLGCQRELAAAGLLQIELDSRPGFVVAAQRTVYTLPATDEQMDS